MPNNYVQQGVFLTPGDPNSMDDAKLYAPGTLGARFIVKQPTSGAAGAVASRFKGYQIVQTDSTMGVGSFPGAVGWWSDKTKYLVTTDPTKLGRGRVAGVFNNASVKGNFTCIQWLGPCTVKFVDAPVAAPTAAGLIVIPSATAAKADCLAAGSSATYPQLGYSAGALNAGDQTAIVDLDVPETP